ncbi:alpha/beta hydrolase-fold protein [Amorphoplanes nipponensis]|uniref:Esterase n=1 Tax=Actinoplanes nipponensis TaxID=135950 RepID=A0A919JE28_9ACTN|nr:alpha/beta hydrolase-fold protein [Actinoplanes nipponensis]GIE47277.1 esterase [Actinoplanes nipponensis]
MSIDGRLPVVAGVIAVLAATTVLAAGWDRRRAAGRGVAVALVVLALTATAALQLNRLTETYPTWASLAGRSPEDADLPLREPTVEAAASTGPHRPGHSRLLTVMVSGTASGLNLSMYVYLPAAYSTPQGQNQRFPVIEALHGYPGSPSSWVRRLDVVHHLDTEMAAGRMAPTVVLLPYQTPDRLLDTECTDLAGGPRTETFLTQDVPRFARTRLRVRTDRAGWGLIGYSAGGFCAMNLALRHPGAYAAGASLSGYPDPGITVGDGSEKTTNNIAWRLRHRPPPATSLYVAWAADDTDAADGSRRIAQLARSPLFVTTAVLPAGGHSHAAWRQMESPAFDWLSAHLARAESVTGR